MVGLKQGFFFICLLILGLLFSNSVFALSLCTCDEDSDCINNGGVCNIAVDCYAPESGNTGVCEGELCSVMGGTCKSSCSLGEVSSNYYCLYGFCCMPDSSFTCPSNRAYFDCATCVGKDSSSAPYQCTTCCNCQTSGGGGGEDFCNEDGLCDPLERFECPDCKPKVLASGTPVQSISFNNLLTGFVTYSSCTPKYSSCSAITDGGICDVCCPSQNCGNGIIDAGEECDGSNLNGKTCSYFGFDTGTLFCVGCRFDTSGCGYENVTRCELLLDASSCLSQPACRWCPVPKGTLANDFTTYPYLVPGQPLTKDHWCVNVSAFDPFNCGSCGFNEQGLHLYKSSGGGFCDSSTPFCYKGSCVSPSSSLNAYSLYASTHSGISNFYQPYKVVYDMTFDLYKADVGSVSPALRADVADRLYSICYQVAGNNADYVYETGCCGDYKCRSFGNICGVTRLCNGSIWLDASNPEISGLVFTPSRCFTPYPIAAINSEFVKCIDDNKYDAYVSELSQMSQSCIPSRKNQPLPVGGTGGLQYSCPFGSYLAAMVTGNAYSSCDVEKISTFHDGHLVCTITNPVSAANNAFGFVSIIDTNVDVGGVAFDRPGQNSYAYCPAPFSSWKRPNGLGLDITPQNNAFMPCPGMINVSTFSLSTTPISLALTGVGGQGTYAGLFCVKQLYAQANNEETGLYALDYVKGNGTVMGSVNGHQYLCYTPPPLANQNLNSFRAKIGVCCGSSLTNCDEAIPGSLGSGSVRYVAGQFINSSSGKLYCRSDGTWGADLDYDAAACTYSTNRLFTGRYCCSEDDDMSVWVNESYSDPGSSLGACFKGVFQRNNRSLVYNGITYTNVLIKAGEFLGCGFNDSLFKGEFALNNRSLCLPGVGGRLSQSCLQNIEDWPNPGAGAGLKTNAPLIKGNDYCSLVSVGSDTYFCSYSNIWNKTSQDSWKKSVVPEVLFDYFKRNYSSSGGDPSQLLSANCCLANQCWDSLKKSCVNEQLAVGQGEYVVSGTDTYKCIGGQWINIAGPLKRTPDGCDSGYCPESDQCLFSLFGDPRYNNNVSPSANPQCIKEGQYKGDYLCRNGNWTTRTKLLALKLISLIASEDEDYILMCGSPSEVLNNPQSQPSNINSFCALNRNGQRIIGVTLNQPLINQSPGDYNFFLHYLDQSFSMSYPNSGLRFDYSACPPSTNFDRCMRITDSSGKGYLSLYYDSAYNMVILSNEDVTGLNPSFGQVLCDSQYFPSWLKWLCPVPSSIEEILSGISLFNKLFVANDYVSGTGGFVVSRNIFGIAEQVCNPITKEKVPVYAFNYSYFSSVDLSYLVSFVHADKAVFTPVGAGGNVFIKKPQRDPWVALTVMRNLEQK